MTVVTNNTIQPASGQALTIKDEGGTASITVATNGNLTFAGTLENTGDNTITNGNLVIGTAGKGIDFSAQTATSASGASTTSEVLDHYEEGTWTPAFSATSCSWTVNSANGYYTKIGDTVTFSFWIKTTAVSGTTTNTLSITGLPFTSKNSTNYYGFTSINYVYNWNMDIGAGQFPGFRIEQNVTRLDPFRNINNDTPVTIPASSTDDSDVRIVAGGVYKAA
jgi:hypothetical protein